MNARRRSQARAIVIALVVSSSLVDFGCKKKTDASSEVAGEELPTVNDATTGLLLTWVDDRGEFHTEQRVSDVPQESRDVVRVRDPAREPLSGGRTFVVDLRASSPDGTYPVHIVPGSELEDIAVTRRAKHGIVLAPKGAASAPASPSASPSGGVPQGNSAGSEPAGRPAVIIYGASWCGPCHQAAAFLKSRGISFIEHDIEKDSSAAREMQGKLAKVGMRSGSIPVLDVRGHILVGFDAGAVERALAQPL